MDLDYTFKSNLTTVLTTVLFPILASYGVSEGTYSAIVVVLAYVVCLVIALYGERYVSSFLTKDPNDEGVCVEVGSDFEGA